MSSTISLATINAKIDALLGEVALLRAAANSAPVAVSSTAKTTAAPVKQPRKKRDGPPSAWIIFTNRVRDLLRGNGYIGADLGKQCQMFCGSLKDENKELTTWSDADILARRAAWAAPAVTKQAEAGLHWKNGKKVVTPTGSAANSVVSGGDADGDADGAAPVSTDAPKKARKNPWEGLTPEQRAAKVAAMKAGKDAKKAGSTTDSVTESADSAAKVVVQAPPSPVIAASSSVAVTNAAAANSSPDEFKGVMLGGSRYLVNLATGHCYRREADGSQGDWAGIFHRTGGPKNGPWIDETVAEPTDDDNGDDLVFDE
jgi:hypothetical protein